VFPSMLSNGLFVAALCLIVTIFLSVVRAKENRRYVAIGASCMFLLMNIHSYDALLVTFVLIGFAIATWFQKELTAAWVGRAVLIGLGAVPPALYFAYVLRKDAVFQARAATETFSPNFRIVLLGLLFPVVLGIAGLATRNGDTATIRRRRLGAGMLTLLLLAMFVASTTGTPGYLMSPVTWSVAFVWGIVCVALLRDETPAMNLFISWAILGTVAIYFPALFQRKLAMGIVIPWSVLAALGLSHLLKAQERNARNLIAALAIILFGATSLRWAFREIQLASSNVSNTTMQPVYISGNVQRILDYLNKLEGRHTVIALPGIQSPAFFNKLQETIVGPQLAPIVPDLNPIVSGFTGAYTFAGHWSETPDYAKKRGLLTALFVQNLTDAQRVAALKQTQADYVISPTQESIPEIPIFDFSKIGNVVVDGPQFRLIKLNPAAE